MDQTHKQEMWYLVQNNLEQKIEVILDPADLTLKVPLWADEVIKTTYNVAVEGILFANHENALIQPDTRQNSASTLSAICLKALSQSGQNTVPDQLFPLLKVEYLPTWEMFLENPEQIFETHLKDLVASQTPFLYTYAHKAQDDSLRKTIMLLQPYTLQFDFEGRKTTFTLEKCLGVAGVHFGTSSVFKAKTDLGQYYAFKLVTDPGRFSLDLAEMETLQGSSSIVRLSLLSEERRIYITPWLTEAKCLVQQNSDGKTSAARSAAEIAYDLIQIQKDFVTRGYVDFDMTLSNAVFAAKEGYDGRILSLDRNLLHVHTVPGEVLTKLEWAPLAYFQHTTTYMQHYPVRYFAGLLERFLLQLFTPKTGESIVAQERWFNKFKDAAARQNKSVLQDLIRTYESSLLSLGEQSVTGNNASDQEKYLEGISVSLLDSLVNDSQYSSTRPLLAEFITDLHEFTKLSSHETQLESEYAELITGSQSSTSSVRYEEIRKHIKTNRDVQLKAYLQLLSKHERLFTPFVTYAPKETVVPRLVSSEQFEQFDQVTSRRAVVSQPAAAVQIAKKCVSPPKKSSQKLYGSFVVPRYKKNVSPTMGEYVRSVTGAFLNLFHKTHKKPTLKLVRNTNLLNDISDRLVLCYLEKFDSYAVKPDAERLVWYLSDGIKNLTQKIASLDPPRPPLLKRQRSPRTLSILIKQYEDIREKYEVTKLKTESVELLRQKNNLLHHISSQLYTCGFLKDTSALKYRSERQVLDYLGRDCPSMKVKEYNYADRERSCALLRRQVAELSLYATALSRAKRIG